MKLAKGAYCRRDDLKCPCGLGSNERCSVVETPESKRQHRCVRASEA
jgi:hypothetical protein